MVPLIGHACATDVNLSGYHIPAGVEGKFKRWKTAYDTSCFETLDYHFVQCCNNLCLNTTIISVTYNNWALHHDEKYFPSSHEFKPDRWINSDGTFNRVLAGNFFPFGLGK